MERYIALLRGVNVGGHTKVAMADLRVLLADLGYIGVTTHLNSGNAVFTAARESTGRIAAAIEDRITAALGLAVPVMVRTAGELRAVIDRNPLDVRDPAKFAVAFLAEALDPEWLSGLDPASYAPEELVAGERELYLFFPNGLGRTKLTPLLAERLGTPATIRNWNTVTKLLKLTNVAQ